MTTLTCKLNGHFAWAMILEPGMAVPPDAGGLTYHLETRA